MSIPASVLVDTLAQFKQDWAGVVCPNCGHDKWRNSPFCRKCSIRLQRKNLFFGWRSWTGHTVKAMFRFWGKASPEVAYLWVLWYDRCRDYLAVSARV